MEMPITTKVNGIDIDASFAEHIKELNRLGYKTRWCCSGLLQDHPEGPFGDENGYISFSDQLDRNKVRDIVRAATKVGTFKLARRKSGVQNYTFKPTYRTVVYLKRNFRPSLEVWNQFVRNLGGKI